MRQLFTLVAVWSVLILGVYILGREIFRFFQPGPPLLTLSPKGATLNVDGRSFVTIPWNEVKDLRTVNLTTVATLPHLTRRGDTYRYESEVREYYRDVLGLRVGQDLYERVIAPAGRAMKRDHGLATALGMVDGMVHHIPARRGLGPGWSSIFIREGDDVLVALHHSMLPVSAEALRAEVEARWRAFGRPAAAT